MPGVITWESKVGKLNYKDMKDLNLICDQNITEFQISISNIFVIKVF